MGGPLVDGFAGADLHNLSHVEHGDPVADIAHHGKVVRNEDERELFSPGFPAEG